jgi:hypothetical protein
MGKKKLVTFNLDEERKEVWEQEADNRSRSLSGFIRYAGEREIAGDHESQSGGVDHTEELADLDTKVMTLLNMVDGIDDNLGVIQREISIPDDIQEQIPVVVRALPSQEEEALTSEQIGELTGTSLLRVTQALEYTEEKTGLVEHTMDEEEGERRFYRVI